MMASSMSRQRAGRAFYITILVITLFAAFSFLRPVPAATENSLVLSRSLAEKARECRSVHAVKDQCTFVRENCDDEDAGLLSYLQFYYCSFAKVQPIAFIILIIWLALLFSTIGIAASDFLCINLSTIASVLGMSESLTGVTFLAFGNGSPDVFSTFAAMKSNSGSLAVGELFGAAGFITAVVAASMALVKPFQVARKSFVRDVGFFLVAASFSMFFLVDGRLHLWECVVMVGFYVFYVVFVVTWHWWLNRKRRQKSREAAQLHQPILHSQASEVANDLDDNDATPVPEQTNLLSEQSFDDSGAVEAVPSPTWKVEDIDADDDETRDRYLAEIQTNMRVRRAGFARRSTLMPIRPSLIGVLEFRAVLDSLKRGSPQNPNSPINMRRYSDDALAPTLREEPSQIPSGNRAVRPRRDRAVSVDFAHQLKVNTDVPSLLDVVPETAIYSSNSPNQNDLLSHTPEQSSLTVPAPAPQLLVSPPAPSRDSRSPSPGPSLKKSFGNLRPDGSSYKGGSSDYLAPPGNYFHRPDYHGERGEESFSPGSVSPTTKPNLSVPKLVLVPQSGSSTPTSPFPMYTDSPAVLTPASSRPPSIRLPAPRYSIASSSDVFFSSQPDEGEEEQARFRWWPYAYLPSPQIIAATLFPTVYNWREMSLWDKVLGIVTVPSVFLLTVTLPVVEPEEEEDASESHAEFESPKDSNRPRRGSRIILAPGSPLLAAIHSPSVARPHPHKPLPPSRENSGRVTISSVAVDPSPPDLKPWNRWLVFIQIFVAPLFIVTLGWANVDDDHDTKTLLLLVVSSIVFSLLFLLTLLATTSPDHPPKYRPILCFLGFCVAVGWISTIANEVVGILKTFGVILGISDAILGLTVFAVGNSLGDLVADITVAKLGFPVMALSACFGGPMLNILLGIGISGLYITIRNGSHQHAKHPDKPVKYKPYAIEVSTTLMISGITLLITLAGLLVFVPLNGWRMDRKIGFSLMWLWTLSTIGNLIVEVLGYGGDLASTFG